MVLSLVSSLGNHSPPRDESSTDSEDDSPVDLRKRCVIDRQSVSSDKRKTPEKHQNNFVLTSLLQKKSSHAIAVVEERNRYRHESGHEVSHHHRKQKEYSELETRLRQPRPTTPEYLNSFRTKCSDGVSENVDKDSGFLADRLLMPAPLPLKVLPSQNPFSMKRQYCVKLQQLEENRNYQDAEVGKSVSFRSQRDGGAFRSVGNYDRHPTAKERSDGQRENSDLEKEPKEFVPNYRKFYSRCSNKAKGVDKRDNSHRDITDFEPPVGTDSTTIDDEDIRLKVRNISILKRSSSCSSVFPTHDLEDHTSSLAVSGFPTDSEVGDSYESEDQRHGLKRRLTLPLRGSSASPKNDITLRCLLQAPPAEKRVKSLEIAASCENSLYPNFDSLHGYLSSNEKTQVHQQHQKGILLSDRRVVTPDDYLRAVNKYYLQVFHNFSGLPVLQRLLSDTSSKTSGTHRPPVSPDSPMSTSPGSESTTSGSTDSGVFSDLGADDAGRKRVSRALTGKHVRSGTGASPSTLRTLRQMIEDRRKMKILCKT